MPKILRYFWCWRCDTTDIKAANKRRCKKGHRMKAFSSYKGIAEAREKRAAGLLYQKRFFDMLLRK